MKPFFVVRQQNCSLAPISKLVVGVLFTRTKPSEPQAAPPKAPQLGTKVPTTSDKFEGFWISVRNFEDFGMDGFWLRAYPYPGVARHVALKVQTYFFVCLRLPTMKIRRIVGLQSPSGQQSAGGTYRKEGFGAFESVQAKLPSLPIGYVPGYGIPGSNVVSWRAGPPRD